MNKTKNILSIEFKKFNFSGPFIFLSLSIIFLLIFTTFSPLNIGGPSGNIGVGANTLDIGDRNFYLDRNDGVYANEMPSFLYPFILNSIKYFVSIWGLDEYSKLWNFFVICLSSIISLTSLILISNTAWELFGSKVAKISSWIYILCPYTIFFTLSGSITNYVFIGISFCFWTICKSQIFFESKKDKLFNSTQTILLLSINCIYLSSLRPTTAIFSICFLMIILFFVKPIFFKDEKYYFFSEAIIFISLIFSIWQLSSNLSYINYSIDNFTNETGYFFGVERNTLRNRLLIESDQILLNLKNLFLFSIWKISDFFSGISDIRDTHTIFNESKNHPLFPFLLRVFTGIFYFAPINILALIGMIKQRKIIINNKLWILLFSIFISLSPSIIGVASNRYLFMIYSPFLVFSALIISEI